MVAGLSKVAPNFSSAAIVFFIKSSVAGAVSSGCSCIDPIVLDKEAVAYFGGVQYEIENPSPQHTAVGMGAELGGDRRFG